MSRRYVIKPANRLSLGYYDDGQEMFFAQVDFLGLGTPDAVMVADPEGARLLATNPDLFCELPFICWCVHDLQPLLETHGFMPLEGESS